MTNRRGFLKSIFAAGVSAMILPGAVVTARKWVKPRTSGIYIVNPEWIDAKYEVHFWFSKSFIESGGRNDLNVVCFDRAREQPPALPAGGYRILDACPPRYSAFPPSKDTFIFPFVEL